MPLSSPQAVLSDDGVGIRLGEPDPPEEPLTLQASVPPHQLRLGSLRPHTPYHVRMACASSQGSSPWTHWLPMETPEGGKKELGRGRRCTLPRWTPLMSVPPPASPLTHLARWPPSPSRPVPHSAQPTGVSPGPHPYASAPGRPARIAHMHALCTLPPLPGNRGGGQEDVRVPASPLPCPPVPLGPPENVSAMLNGSQALVRWQKPAAPLQGTLLGYRLAYRGQDTPEVGAAGLGGVEELGRREMERRK